MTFILSLVVAPTLAFSMACLLAGCGGSMWTDRATNPVIIDQSNPGWLNPGYYGVLSTTAGRRSIFVAYRDPTGKLLEKPTICAEPPPDAIDAYTNALGLAASSGKGSAGSPELDIQRTLAVSSALGLYRSQGLQLLRDQEFQLCIMHLSKIIDDTQYLCMYQQMVEVAAGLITREMGAIEIAAGRSGAVVAAPSPPNNSGKPGTNAPGQAPKPTGNVQLSLDVGANGPPRQPDGPAAQSKSASNSTQTTQTTPSGRSGKNPQTGLQSGVSKGASPTTTVPITLIDLKACPAGLVNQTYYPHS